MKNTNLQEIKEQYAKEKGYEDWLDYRNNKLAYLGTIPIEVVYDEIHRLRHTKAKLEEAAENARAYLNANDEPIVIKKSITETYLD